MNADVLEVIAEYACATVADACALRGSCKGYRRAVDTTVRRLVYEDQPELLPPPMRNGSQPATLHVHLNTEHLDAVRIALTCDVFPRIARLVVVAFALDGAKDEAHEGGACGPRPVASSDEFPAAAHQRIIPKGLSSAWVDTMQASPPFSGVSVSLVRCLTDVYVSDSMLTAEVCTAVESAEQPWAGVRRLTAGVCSAGGAVAGLLVRLLDAVGPQLTYLSLDCCGYYYSDLADALASCCHVTELHVSDCCSVPPDNDWVCDALIASGAPLWRVIVPELSDRAAVRLLVAVPTIVSVLVHALRQKHLPPLVRARLVQLNDVEANECLPRLRKLGRSWPDERPLIPSAYATELSSDQPLDVANLATAYPSLEAVSFKRVADNIAVKDIQLPASLTRLEAGSSDSLVAGILSVLTRHGPAHLCHLAQVVLSHGVSSAANIAPLAAFAGTLRVLTVTAWADPGWPADSVAGAELALSQLLGLEELNIPLFPHGRFLIAGRHKRLRFLRLADVDERGSAGVSFDTIVKACPRLIHARGDQEARDASDLPVGWKLGHDYTGAYMQRASFLNASASLQEEES